MTQRTRKVASLIHQIVASEFIRLLPNPEVSVTGVDVTPDLRQATIWVGVINRGSDNQDDLLKEVGEHRVDIQSSVAQQLKSKFVPRLEFRLDTSTAHAEHISRLIKGS